MRCISGDRPKSWAQWLPMAEWWYNTTFHISTGVTPYEALYGQSPPSHKYYTPGGTSVVAADALLQDRDAALRLLKEHLAHSQNRMKQQADLHRTEREFTVGDWVYLRLQPYKQASVALRKNIKLAPKFFGPFQVIQRIGPVAYKLNLPPQSKIHPVFHVSLLKKKLGTRVVAHPTLPPTDAAGQLIVEPVAILDRRLIRRHNRPHALVLVQWANTVPEDATWESWLDLQARFPHFRP